MQGWHKKDIRTPPCGVLGTKYDGDDRTAGEIEILDVCCLSDPAGLIF